MLDEDQCDSCWNTKIDLGYLRLNQALSTKSSAINVLFYFDSIVTPAYRKIFVSFSVFIGPFMLMDDYSLLLLCL